MPIEQIPAFHGDEDPSAGLDSLMDPMYQQHEDVDTPEPPEVEHQEFSDTELPEVDHQEFSTPELPDVYGFAPDIPEPADLGYPEGASTPLPEPYSLLPPEPPGPAGDPPKPSFDYLEHTDIGEPASGEAPGLQSLPWMFPIPSQQMDEEGVPQYMPPETGDVEGPQIEPAPQSQSVPLPDLSVHESDSADIEAPEYVPPQVPQAEMSMNEDLFARVGWPTGPPRIANTHWFA